ncbi:MAG: ABC transporter permease [Bacteroidota bacterium]|nr:ABC transporter permease [Bacteroidota bacterium]MDP4230515.1 ABC transporter permease [Bacteroidota bacterium]MDP4235518.1 ABC transporter permease [Bacteroidota bacterium]
MEFFKNIYPIMWKEFLQIRRDARTLAVLFIVPTLLMLFVGFAVNFDVTHIKIAVLDDDKSSQSRDFIESFVNSDYFDYSHAAHNQQEIDNLLDDGTVAVAVIIPPKFSDHLARGEAADVQVIVDGSNSSTASSVVGYTTGAISSYSSNLRTQALKKMGKEFYSPIDFRPRAWYNPDLSTIKFQIPGLIGYMLILTCVVATTMSIVREKEKGTMEQLVVSRITPFELIAGKLLPYLIIALMLTAILLSISFFVFGVAIKGSIIYLLSTILLYLICALSLGLWVSTVSNSQQVAFQIATLVSTLPSNILSGFIFPIRSMPIPIQIATNFTPAKFFIHAIRAIMLKGVGIGAFWEDWLAMGIFATFMIWVSTRRLKRQKL